MAFSISIADGEVVEQATESEPFVFVLGDGELIEGLERALIGLRAGDRQNLRIAASDAFGLRDSGLVHRMPLEVFDELEDVEVGQVIGFSTEDGMELAGLVTGLAGDEVIIDMNHPLAGHEVQFDVHILEVESRQ